MKNIPKMLFLLFICSRHVAVAAVVAVTVIVTRGVYHLDEPPPDKKARFKQVPDIVMLLIANIYP